MFTLDISWFTTSNLPWFMDITFQVPMQYCFLQHQTLLPSLVTSTAGCCFCFGSISTLFLELVLHWSPVAYWAPTSLGSSAFSVLFFCLFMPFMRFPRQHWSSLPFPSPVDHVLSELSTMTHPSWAALHGMAHSFTELDKAVFHVIGMVSYLPLKRETEFCSWNWRMNSANSKLLPWANLFKKIEMQSSQYRQ